MEKLHNIKYNCKHAQQMGIKAEQEKLSLKEWAALKVHLAYCKYCRNFLIQSKIINKALLFLLKNKSSANLSEDKKIAMQKAINETVGA